MHFLMKEKMTLAFHLQIAHIAWDLLALGPRGYRMLSHEVPTERPRIMIVFGPLMDRKAGVAHRLKTNDQPRPFLLC